MTENKEVTERVDRYLRGELDAGEAAAFESELLESPQLQDALEVALGLQRALEYESASSDAGAVSIHHGSERSETASTSWRSWALAASVAVAFVTGSLLWRVGAENERLHTRIDELQQPVGTVIAVPLDVMRLVDSRAPDVRIRKPAGAALLVLDVEVAARLQQAPVLELELGREQGSVLHSWSAAPDEDGRLQVALRTDRLPDGLLVIRMRDPGSDTYDDRLVELLPAR